MKTIIKTSIFLSILFVSQNIFAVTNFVSKTGGHVSPFDSWVNAATNIQAAVDVASAGNMVLVNDGIYYPGSQISVTKGITVKSVNGADKTIVDGNYTTRCFNVSAQNVIIDGFSIIHAFYQGNWHADEGGRVFSLPSQFRFSHVFLLAMIHFKLGDLQSMSQ